MKILETNIVMDSYNQYHIWDMCEDDGSYYFTLDSVKLDWTFPKICYGSAIRHYNLVLSQNDDVDWVVQWALGENK